MKNKKAQFYMMGAIAMLMAIYILSMFTKEMTILSIKRVTNERMYFLTLKMNHDVYFIKDHEKNYVSLFNDLSAYFSQSEEIFQKNGIDFLWNFTNYSISFEIQAPYLIINNTLLFKQPLIKPPAIKKYVCIVINSTSFLDSLFTGKLPILINNSNNPNDLTNFQISLNLTYLPGMSPTFQDIRFVYYNTTTNQYQELPYWIQSKVDGKWAYVWIKVPFIPSNTTNIGYGNGITYIWLYYNNITTLPNDPLANNGTATFEFFDDFENNPNTDGKWVIFRDHTSNVECYWDPTTHLFYLTKAYNGLGCMAFFAKNGKPIKINYPFLAEFEYKVGGGTGADGMTFAFDKDITNFEKYNDSVGGGTLGLLPSSPTGVVPSNGYAIELDEYYNYEFDPSGDHVALVLNGPSDHLIYYNTPKVKDNQWHTLKAIVSPPITKVYLDNQLLFTYTKLTPLGYGYAGFSGATGALTDNHIIKFVLVRKYFPNPLLIVPSHYYQYLNCSYITT